MKCSLRPAIFGFVSFLVLGSCPAAIAAAYSLSGADSDQGRTAPSAPAPAAPAAARPVESIVIPGPLRSFERMAALSQKVRPAEVMPLFARNVYMRGYQEGKPDEYLRLVDRYLSQARELQLLAGSNQTIRVTGCDDAGTLIQILGYRLRAGCGQKTFSLETANPERAFLTIDSGFPLVDLEEALQNKTTFVYSYPATRVPVLFREADWTGLHPGQKRRPATILDALMSDPNVAALYWAMSKLDTETTLAMERSPGLRGLVPFAGVLDFYGSQISVRSNRVTVPGGESAEAGWKELVGASPEQPGQFVLGLVSKDNGWLAAYFDTLSRVSQVQQQRLTESPRLKRLYENFKIGEPHANATRGVFRKAPDLLVLFTRVSWEADGQPHIPGDIAVWKQIVDQKTDNKALKEWAKRAHSWERPEQVLEGMAGLARIDSDSGPLQVFLMATEIDRNRQPANRLLAATVQTMSDRVSDFSAWYPMFTEFPQLDDASLTRFLTLANGMNSIPNQALRGNAVGSFQAAIGLWQILARQRQIPVQEMNASWLKVVEPFGSIASPAQLFDASRSSLVSLMTAAGSNSAGIQFKIVDLLAGPTQLSAEGQRAHLQLTGRVGSVLEDQRLVSLDTLFALSDGLKEMVRGGGKGSDLLPLAEELHEFDLPRPIFTHSEKINWAPTIYNDHHAELQVKTDLAKIIKGPSSPAQLEIARGLLAPFLRDTMVGLNYAYYEPPGAQMLHHNPLFVRSHDFLGVSMIGSRRLWGPPRLVGVGIPAGGGAYLMGSLADLSYSLANAEQDFIAPKNVQALIWNEMVPTLLVSSTIPRWWSITPDELHATALYQRSGEELLTASAGDAELKKKVLAVLSDRMTPQRLEQIGDSMLRAEDVAAMIPHLMPAETGYLAAEYRSRFQDEAPTWGPSSQQLQELRSRAGGEVSWERISHDFGVPHPTLAQTNARELLNLKPFPMFGSYSSRLFSESWESGNLYWARLADEMGYSPVSLNSLIPELTRSTIANIFATDLEDWQAVLRAMQETGEEFRHSKVASLPAGNTTSLVSEQAARIAPVQ